MLELKDVTISYKKVPTVQQFNMSMKQGQIISSGRRIRKWKDYGDPRCFRIYSLVAEK